LKKQRKSVPGCACKGALGGGARSENAMRFKGRKRKGACSVSARDVEKKSKREEIPMFYNTKKKLLAGEGGESFHITIGKTAAIFQGKRGAYVQRKKGLPLDVSGKERDNKNNGRKTSGNSRKKTEIPVLFSGTHKKDSVGKKSPGVTLDHSNPDKKEESPQRESDSM